MSKELSTLADRLRDAIETSGETRYAICKRSGVDQAAMLRFMDGGSLRIESAEKLADALGLELVLKPKSKRKE